MTDRELEEYLHHTVRKERLDIPETLDSKVRITLKKVLRRERRREAKIFLRRRAPAAAAAACILIVTSVSAYAGVNRYQERMAALSEAEKDKAVDEIERSRSNADTFSRNLTDEEITRLWELNAEYEKGTIFPESEMLVVDKEKQAEHGTLAFATDTSTFFFPDSDMTNEELLQVIDFYHKRDYSLASRKSELLTSEKTDRFAQLSKIPEEDAIQTARKLVEDICGIETDDYLVSVATDTGQGYLISLSGFDDARKYKVSVDNETGKIRAFDFIGAEEFLVRLTVDEELYIREYTNAKKLLRSCLGVENNILESYCTYSVVDDECLIWGKVNYVFILDNGSSYVMSYDAYNNHIVEAQAVYSDQYEELMNKSYEIQEKHEISKKRIDFIQ